MVDVGGFREADVRTAVLDVLQGMKTDRSCRQKQKANSD